MGGGPPFLLRPPPPSTTHRSCCGSCHAHFCRRDLLYISILDFEGGISYISHINILYMSMSAWCVKVLVVLLFRPLLAFWCLGHCASRFMFQIKFLKPGQRFSITDLTF